MAATEWTPYTSGQYRYSLKVPENWIYHPATEDWPQDVYPVGGSSYIDQWELPPGPFPVIDIMTQRLASGMSVEEFMAWLDRNNAKLCTVESTEDIVVDGSTGRLQRQTCGYNAYEVAVFDERRVYLIYWIGGEIEDRALFEEILSTFRFAP